MQMQIFVFAALLILITLSSTEMGAKEKQGMKFIITFTTLIKFSTFIHNGISIEHGHFQQGCSQLPRCKALGGSITLCYSVTKSELNAQAFVCITGFSLFLLWFIVNCFCVACNFRWYHRSDKSVV